MAVWEPQVQRLLAARDRFDEQEAQNALDFLVSFRFVTPAFIKLVGLVSPESESDVRSVATDEFACGRMTAADLEAGRISPAWERSRIANARSESVMFWLTRLARRSTGIEETLALLLRDPQDALRCRAAFVAGRLGFHDLVFAALSDASSQVRRLAVRAIGDTSGSPPKSRTALVPMLDDPYPGVCAEAALALTKLGAMGGTAEGIRAALKRAIEAAGTPEADHAAFVLADIAKSDPAGKEIAVRALAELLQRQGVSPGIKWQALDSLAVLGPRAQAASEAIRSIATHGGALGERASGVLRHIASRR